MNRALLLCFRGTVLPACLLACTGLAAAQETSAPGTAAVMETASVLPMTAAPGTPAPFAIAETTTPGVSSSLANVPAPGDTSAAALPDAPSATLSTPASPLVANYVEAPGQTATPNVAPKYAKYIPAGYVAQPLTAHDKVVLGLKDLYSPLNFLSVIISAGYEHVTNSSPNYGTDKGAFGERLGAAEIRETTEGLFTDAVFTPLFHEDPRYYVRGYGHSFLDRTFHAASRTLVTRTDNGGHQINAGLLLGYAASSALSYTYYPQINKNFHDTASTFGSSVGGAALGFAVDEFSDDILIAIHLKKKP